MIRAHSTTRVAGTAPYLNAHVPRFEPALQSYDTPVIGSLLHVPLAPMAERRMVLVGPMLVRPLPVSQPAPPQVHVAPVPWRQLVRPALVVLSIATLGALIAMGIAYVAQVASVEEPPDAVATVVPALIPELAQEVVEPVVVRPKPRPRVRLEPAAPSKPRVQPPPPPPPPPRAPTFKLPSNFKLPSLPGLRR